MSKLWPSLSRTHPGYFKVVASIVFIHLALAVDAARPGAIRRSPSWTVLDAMVDGRSWIFSILHVSLVAAIFFGLYRPACFAVARVGLFLSCVLFNGMAVGFFVSGLENNYSLTAAVACAGMSLCSAAAFREPTVQPLRRNQ